MGGEYILEMEAISMFAMKLASYHGSGESIAITTITEVVLSVHVDPAAMTIDCSN